MILVYRSPRGVGRRINDANKHNKISIIGIHSHIGIILIFIIL